MNGWEGDSRGSSLFGAKCNEGPLYRLCEGLQKTDAARNKIWWCARGPKVAAKDLAVMARRCAYLRAHTLVKNKKRII